MSEKTATRVTRIGTVAVPVSDPDRSLDFYVGTLGFEKRRDVPFGPGLRWIEVAPAGAITTIALAPRREDVPIGIETGIRLYTDDAEAEHAELLARGIDVDADIMRFGAGVPPMFYVRDPDGNALVIVEGA